MTIDDHGRDHIPFFLSVLFFSLFIFALVAEMENPDAAVISRFHFLGDPLHCRGKQG
jgi:hypothetical protein